MVSRSAVGCISTAAIFWASTLNPIWDVADVQGWILPAPAFRHQDAHASRHELPDRVGDARRGPNRRRLAASTSSVTIARDAASAS
jgi:hypothetical protein